MRIRPTMANYALWRIWFNILEDTQRPPDLRRILHRLGFKAVALRSYIVQNDRFSPSLPKLHGGFEILRNWAVIALYPPNSA